MCTVIIIGVIFHTVGSSTAGEIISALQGWAEQTGASITSTSYPDELGRFAVAFKVWKEVRRFDSALHAVAMKQGIIAAAEAGITEPANWYDEATWWAWEPTWRVIGDELQVIE